MPNTEPIVARYPEWFEEASARFERTLHRHIMDAAIHFAQVEFTTFPGVRKGLIIRDYSRARSQEIFREILKHIRPAIASCAYEPPRTAPQPN